MKQEIVGLLKTKSQKDTVDLTAFLKGMAKDGTREKVREVKNLLRGMSAAGEITVLNDTHENLDQINPEPIYNEEGTATPTRYHNFDTVSIIAKGTGNNYDEVA